MADIRARLTELVGPALAGLLPEQQPAIVALAERIAGGRYEAWAAQAPNAEARVILLGCAAREREIAERVEATVPEAQAIQARAEADHPTLREGYADMFGGLSFPEQLSLQASAERIGAETWRGLAKSTTPEIARVYLACADLEEASAEAVEALVASGTCG